MNINDISWRAIYEFFKDWQTLLAALLALGAAYWTVRVMRSQIEQTEQHERERRRGPYEAARAMLPLDLNDVVVWIRAHAEIYKRTYDMVPSNPVGPLITPDKVPTIDRTALQNLKDMIERDEDSNARAILSLIIKKYQYLQSRMKGLVGPTTTSRNQSGHDRALYESAHMHVLCELIYPYARREEDKINLSRISEALYNALSILDLQTERRFEQAEKLARDKLSELRTEIKVK